MSNIKTYFFLENIVTVSLNTKYINFKKIQNKYKIILNEEMQNNLILT